MAGATERIFKRPEDLFNRFKEYYEDCINKNLLPNVIGFCVHCNMSRDTYYGYKDYDDGAYIPTLKKLDDFLEVSAVNRMFADRNPVAAMFYLKNKFNWADKQEITNNLTINNDFTQLSDAELENKLAELGYAKTAKQLDTIDTKDYKVL